MALQPLGVQQRQGPWGASKQEIKLTEPETAKSWQRLRWREGSGLQQAPDMTLSHSHKTAKGGAFLLAWKHDYGSRRLCESIHGLFKLQASLICPYRLNHWSLMAFMGDSIAHCPSALKIRACLFIRVINSRSFLPSCICQEGHGSTAVTKEF